MRGGTSVSARLRRGQAALTILLMWCATAAAEVTNAVPIANPLPNAGASLLRVAGAMILVFGLFFAGIWCFRNWQRFSVKRNGPSKLQILEVKALANRQFLYLVACGRQRLLLGSSAAGLTALSQVTEPWPDAVAERVSNGKDAFGETLEAALEHRS